MVDWDGVYKFARGIVNAWFYWSVLFFFVLTGVFNSYLAYSFGLFQVARWYAVLTISILVMGFVKVFYDYIDEKSEDDVGC